MKTHLHNAMTPARGRTNLIRSVGMVVASVLAMGVGSAPAGDFEESIAEPTYDSPVEGWKFAMDVYAWLPGISAESNSGYTLDLDLDDILDHLDMTIMAGMVANKGPWSIGADVLYLDLGGEGRSTGLLDTKLDVEMKTWVVDPRVGYSVYEGDRGNLELVAGVRYIYLKEHTRFILGPIDRKQSNSGDSWSGVVGVRGNIKLSERWFMPYYADIGAGDPDLTWQAFLGVGYHFSKFDLIGGYRYLKFEFDESDVFKDLRVNGPVIGAKFDF